MKYILVLLFIYSIPITSRTSDTHIIKDILSREPAYTHRQMFIESSYRHHQISKQGAVGIMQVKPTTASELLHMPVTIKMLQDSAFCEFCGILYMNKLRRFWKALGYESKPLESMTLMAYNEGPGLTIKRHFKRAVAKQLCQAYWHYDNHNIMPLSLSFLTIPKSTKYTKDILCINP